MDLVNISVTANVTTVNLYSNNDDDDDDDDASNSGASGAVAAVLVVVFVIGGVLLIAFCISRFGLGTGGGSPTSNTIAEPKKMKSTSVTHGQGTRIEIPATSAAGSLAGSRENSPLPQTTGTPIQTDIGGEDVGETGKTDVADVPDGDTPDGDINGLDGPTQTNGNIDTNTLSVASPTPDSNVDDLKMMNDASSEI